MQTLAANNVNNVTFAAIDADLDITASTDPEVMFRWFSMGLSLEYSPVYIPAYTFISYVGRGKYVFPIYQALVSSGQRDKAVSWNSDAAFGYSIIVEAGIQAILQGVVETPSEL